MSTPSLDHVVWIGGSPCSGKSSIARALSRQYGLHVYETDALEARPATPEQPTKTYLQTLTPDQLWLRPVAVQTSTELDYCREECAVAVRELQALPASPGVVAEGTALLPHGVVPHLTRPRQAIWLVPTRDFQRHAYPRRGSWPHEVVAGSSDPARAFDQWMERDVGYARVVAVLARTLGQRVVEVDGSQPVAEVYEMVADHLGFAEPRYECE